ncbi:MAG: YceI family protein [Pseudomonadota bacterium]
MKQTIALFFMPFLLAACTALRVATHHPSSDAAQAPAGLYHADPEHKSLSFAVAHMGFSRFVARFDAWDASLDFDNNSVTQSRVTARIMADSLSAPAPVFDGLIKGKDMLDAASHPEITFVSTALEQRDARSGLMHGILTIRGRSAPVTLAVTFNGGARNPLTGVHTLGFSATGTFARSAFGLAAWPIVVADEVTFSIEVEFRYLADLETKK